MISLSTINQKLRDHFGYFHSKPKFRIAWTDDLFELRRGTFEIVTNGIYLGTEVGIKKVRKYRYIVERHIIEVAVPFTLHDDIVTDEKISYEHIYTFEDRARNPLPLDWEMTELYCKSWLQVMEKEFRYPEKEESLVNKEMDKKTKEIERIKEVIQHEAPNLAYGSGVVVPGNYNGTAGDSSIDSTVRDKGI